MLNIDIITRDFNVNGNGSNYAKIFTIKRYFLNQVLYQENQLIFKIIHANSYSGCSEKTYFIGVYEDASQIDKITFQDLSHNTLVNEIDCAYVVNSNNDVDVYVKGTNKGSLLNIQFLYCRHIGIIQTYNYAIFNNDLSGLNVISPIKQIKINKWTSIALQNNWNNEGLYNAAASYTIDNNGYVLLRGAISNTTLSGSVTSIIGVLPEGCRPICASGFSLMSENNSSGVYNLLIKMDGKMEIRTSDTTIGAMIHLESVRFQKKE